MLDRKNLDEAIDAIALGVDEHTKSLELLHALVERHGLVAIDPYAPHCDSCTCED